jgi:hypothetical protein
MIKREKISIGFVEKIGFMYLHTIGAKEKLCFNGNCVTILGKKDEDFEIEVIKSDTIAVMGSMLVEELEKRNIEYSKIKDTEMRGIIIKDVPIIPTIFTVKENKNIMVIVVPEERGLKFVLADNTENSLSEFFPLVWDSIMIDYLDNVTEVTNIEVNVEDLDNLLEDLEEI